MMKDGHTERLALCVCPQIGLKAKRINGGYKSFYCVQWRPRNRRVLRHVTSVGRQHINQSASVIMQIEISQSGRNVSFFQQFFLHFFQNFLQIQLLEKFDSFFQNFRSNEISSNQAGGD